MGWILGLGLLAGAAGFCSFYFLGTAAHRQLRQSNAPELAWLKREFNLSEAEFRRISELHDGYRANCEAMCQRIDAKNAELRELLAQTNRLTPPIEAKLAEAAALRLECQRNMLSHFYEVSRTMPPEQGRRYLRWVQARTFLPNSQMHEAH